MSSKIIFWEAILIALWRFRCQPRPFQLGRQQPAPPGKAGFIYGLQGDGRRRCGYCASGGEDEPNCWSGPRSNLSR